MLQFIVKGFIIGILVSAPMGPIGILCVQRTLNRGRWHGFFTGLGAMMSDLIYALIMLGGISIIDEFFTKNEILLQVLGSIVLMFFGYRVFRSNPLKGWSPTFQNEGTRYVKDFITSFLFTLSNVAILLVFITLFARFHYNPLELGVTGIAISLGSIAIGALSWWFTLSLVVSRLRKHFNRKGLILLNKLIGSILIIIGLIGVTTSF
ncbi:MAG: LysE family transporter [Proteiniphilum sp.]|nr:LysE family transporter [Proteiniphilum sp.]